MVRATLPIHVRDEEEHKGGGTLDGAAGLNLGDTWRRKGFSPWGGGERETEISTLDGWTDCDQEHRKAAGIDQAEPDSTTALGEMSAMWIPKVQGRCRLRNEESSGEQQLKSGEWMRPTEVLGAKSK